MNLYQKVAKASSELLETNTFDPALVETLLAFGGRRWKASGALPGRLTADGKPAASQDEVADFVQRHFAAIDIS